MPCFKKANRGRTPEQVSSLKSRKLLDLDETWSDLRRVLSMNAAGHDVAGEWTVLLEADVAGYLESLLSSDKGNHRAALSGLRDLLPRLDRVASELPIDEARPYSSLVDLVREMLLRMDAA